MKTTKLDGYLDKIKNLFSEESTEEKPEETTEQTTGKFGMVEAEGADGSIEITFPGDALEVGAEITTMVDEEAVPVPTGEYTLSDGSILVVAEEGIVGEVKVAEAAEESAEDMETDGLKGEQIEQLVNGIAEILATFRTEVEAKFEAAVKTEVDKIRAEFNKPAAEVKNEIVKGLNRFVKESNQKQ
jgi:hypothetical protein